MFYRQASVFDLNYGKCKAKISCTSKSFYNDEEIYQIPNPQRIEAAESILIAFDTFPLESESKS